MVPVETRSALLRQSRFYGKRLKLTIVQLLNLQVKFAILILMYTFHITDTI